MLAVTLVLALSSSAMFVSTSDKGTLLILGGSIATGHSLPDYDSSGNPKSEYSWATLLSKTYGAEQVNLEYEDGATVSFTMSAFNKGGRKIRVMGTKGEINAEMKDDHITFYDFATRETTEISITDAVLDEHISGGHGGGDRGIIRSFCQYLAGTYEGNSITDISTSIENHLVTFAAEKSRVEGSVVNVEDYINCIRNGEK